MPILIGLDVGQRSEPSGLCVIEQVLRSGATKERTHFLVRHLEQVPAGTPYPRLAQRTAEVAAKTHQRSTLRPDLFVDVTGLGEPVLGLLTEEVQGRARVIPVYFTYGDRRLEEGQGREVKITLGKAWLVSRLQVLLQTGCLHLPRIREAETLAQELLAYEVQVDDQANERYGAFRVGKHDDLVTALGLAVQPRPQQLYGGQTAVGAWG